MKTLQQLREEIDIVDAELVNLLERRADLVLEVKAVKEKDAIDVYSPARELEIIKRVRSLGEKGHFPLPAMERIFGSIVSASRSLIGELGVCFHGAEFSSAHRATLQQFGESIKTVATVSAREALAQVERGESHFAVLPIERRGEGIITESVDALVESPLVVSGEIFLAIDNAVDRFLWVGTRRTISTGNDKTILLCAVKDRAGALSDLLSPFAEAGLTLTKIESKESRKGAWEHRFIFEFIGHRDDAVVTKVLTRLQAQCSTLSVLGSYPIAGEHTGMGIK